MQDRKRVVSFSRSEAGWGLLEAVQEGAGQGSGHRLCGPALWPEPHMATEQKRCGQSD